MANSSEETFLRNQCVFNQGDLPQFVHVVAKGEFEVLRNKKTKFALMDPTKEGMMDSASNLQNDHMLKLLKNRNLRNNHKKMNSSTDVLSNMGNTLYQGSRGQKGQIRIMIAGSGHMFGWEDIYRDRLYTTSVNCYSKTAQVIKIPVKDFLNCLKKDEKIYK